MLQGAAALQYSVFSLLISPWPNTKASKLEYNCILEAGTEVLMLVALLSEDPIITVHLIKAGPVNRHTFVETPLASPFFAGH
jgi:hypothetical protein